MPSRHLTVCLLGAGLMTAEATNDATKPTRVNVPTEPQTREASSLSRVQVKNLTSLRNRIPKRNCSVHNECRRRRQLNRGKHRLQQ
ncbi:hypothetical protein BaRGS_00003539 [Batillaria attramentaria]|uniref:Uncharacterized protein n=1 Tax=Batillaria attramentaria TaxID=370345 RepID=A0ABD0M2E1_9CAEN